MEEINAGQEANSSKMHRHSYHENAYAEFWIENGVLYNIYKPSLHIMDMKAARAIIDLRHKITDGKPLPVLVDTKNATMANAEVRDFMANPHAVRDISACAIIVRSPLMKLAANIYLYVDQPAAPAKLFNEWGKAIKWLARFK